MRYRPLGSAGAAVSSLTLRLGREDLARGRNAVRDLIFSALEAGVNAYHLDLADPVLAQAAGDALAHVERRLICVGLTLGHTGRGGRDFSAEALSGAVDVVLKASGLGWIDLAVLDEPADDELPQASLLALKALRRAGLVRLLGVQGDAPVMDVYVSTGAFDALYTPYHPNVEWRIRSRMKAARERDMAIFAYDYFPDSLAAAHRGIADAASPRKRGFFGLGRQATPASPPADAFAFLHHTPNWAAEDICLAYALTDPAIASLLASAADGVRLQHLATVSEKDLPPGLPAQIEMARVGPVGSA